MWDVLSFDIDGTLVRRDAAVRELLATRVEPRFLETALDLDDRNDNPRLFEWLAGHGHFSTSAAARSWFRRDLPRHVRANPDVQHALQRLGRHHRLLVISNGGAGQRTKLANAELSALFDHVYISAETRSRKPAATMFRRASNDMCAEPSRILHIGDDPVADVAGARAVGFGTCWISHGRPYPADGLPPTLQVRDVAELAQRLRC